MYQSISGFPEFSPSEQIAFNRLIRIITKHYESVGAVPLETCAVERVKTVMGKAASDKEIYALRRLAAEAGENDAVELALRFDLTLPMVRYVAQHGHDLHFPFRRYQIQPVWRGERAQKGRYRQFLQCDIDVIGDTSLSLLNDAEMPAIIARVFSELKLGEFLISLNNRKIIQGFLHSMNQPPELMRRIIKIIDALDKTGTDIAAKSLAAIGIATERIDRLFEFFQANDSTDETLAQLKTRSINQEYENGVRELETVIEYMRALQVVEKNFRIDTAIVRGLDYYTGTVYETHLSEQKNIGSVCSGGRYDELLQKIGAKRPMPGVGISIGLTRIFPLLTEKGMIPLPPPTTAAVLVSALDRSLLKEYLSIGAAIRENGINAEIYTESKQLGKQLKYAAQKGFSCVVIAGDKELSQQKVILRFLKESKEELVERHLLPQRIRQYLSDAETNFM